MNFVRTEIVRFTNEINYVIGLIEELALFNPWNAASSKIDR